MVNGFHEKALLTASLRSAFRPSDKMDALFFPHKHVSIVLNLTPGMLGTVQR